MSKPSNKLYELRLMADMLAIPEDRFDEFLIDLKKWHIVAKGFDDLFKAVSDVAGEKVPKDYMIMRWTDDSIHSGPVKINITTTDKAP